MKYRQNRAVFRGIYKFFYAPRTGQRPRLRLPVANETSDDQLRTVERRAVSRGKRIPELAALQNDSGGSRTRVARKSIRPAKITRQICNTFLIKRSFGIIF